MEYLYPSEFPKESRSRVFAERIKAGRAFEEAKREARDNSDVANLRRSCILRVFLVFVREASELVRQGIPNWSVDRLDSESREFLRHLTIFAPSVTGYDLSGMISNLNGSILPDVQDAFEKSPLWREYENVLLDVALATSTSGNAEAPEDATTSEQLAMQADWEDIEISFISDHRVQVTAGGQTITYNYAEMGFGDGRSQKPNQGWGILRALAQTRGFIPESARDSKDFIAMGKRIERTRRTLKDHFHIGSDPIPLDKVRGYRCRFKIGCAASFEK